MAYSEIDFSDPGFLMNYCENLSLEIASLKSEVEKLTACNPSSLTCLCDTCNGKQVCEWYRDGLRACISSKCPEYCKA